MSGVIVTNPKVQFLGANGAPLVGGTLTTYLAGTTTPTATYQDEALTAANTNPIVLDARGECLLWLDSTKNYKFVLANSSGVVQWTVDDISGPINDALLRSILGAANGASLIGYTGPAPTSAVTTVDQLAATGTNKGADLVGFLQAGANTVPRTAQSKMREIQTPADFGAAQSSPLFSVSGLQDRYNIVFNAKYNAIAGGNSNVIAGGGNGTSNNEILGATDYQTISGGYDNTINECIASTIGGGAHHNMLAGVTHGTIGGGSYNDIEAGDYGTIAGGTGNTVNGSDGTVSGGINNTAGQDATVGGGSTNTATGRYAVVAGGTLNDAASQAGTIAGGDNNDITNSTFSSIGGGYQNKLGHVSYSGSASVIGGGYQNLIAQTAQAQYATIAGGRGNVISASYASILGGQNNIASGSHSAVLGGSSAIASATRSVASGSGNAAHYGAQAHSSVSGTTFGQRLQLTAARTTTDGATSELLLDGSTIFLFIPDNTVWAIKAVVAATRTDVVGEYAMYKVDALIKRDATAATTSVLSSSVTDIFETTAAWSFSLSVSTSNGQVRFRPTGEAAKTIRWFATIDITEVKSA